MLGNIDLDEKLSWEKHIEKICNKVGVGIGAMRRIKPYVLLGNLQTNPKTLVQVYFDYFFLLRKNAVNNSKIDWENSKFQNHAAKIIPEASYDVTSTDIFNTLAW